MLLSIEKINKKHNLKKNIELGNVNIISAIAQGHGKSELVESILWTIGKVDKQFLDLKKRDSSYKDNEYTLNFEVEGQPISLTRKGTSENIHINPSNMTVKLDLLYDTNFDYSLDKLFGHWPKYHSNTLMPAYSYILFGAQRQFDNNSSSAYTNFNFTSGVEYAYMYRMFEGVLDKPILVSQVTWWAAINNGYEEMEKILSIAENYKSVNNLKRLSFKNGTSREEFNSMMIRMIRDKVTEIGESHNSPNENHDLEKIESDIALLDRKIRQLRLFISNEGNELSEFLKQQCITVEGKQICPWDFENYINQKTLDQASIAKAERELQALTKRRADLIEIRTLETIKHLELSTDSYSIDFVKEYNKNVKEYKDRSNLSKSDVEKFAEKVRAWAFSEFYEGEEVVKHFKDMKHDYIEEYLSIMKETFKKDSVIIENLNSIDTELDFKAARTKGGGNSSSFLISILDRLAIARLYYDVHGKKLPFFISEDPFKEFKEGKHNHMTFLLLELGFFVENMLITTNREDEIEYLPKQTRVDFEDSEQQSKKG